MNEDHHEGKSYMARRNLYDIYKNVEMMLSKVEEGETLEDWMEHKISTARNAISDVASAYSYDKDMDSCGCGEEEVETPIMTMSDTPDTIIRKVESFNDWIKKRMTNIQ
jgi:hypothetical protein